MSYDAIVVGEFARLSRATVPGLYALGDIARAPHSVGRAVADGMRAGMSPHHALMVG